MAYKLTSADHTLSFELRAGSPQLVGRAPTCDLPIIDPTISRRHAEVECVDGGVQVRDLGSSNGTFVNGVRIEHADLVAGDSVTFGKVELTLEEFTPRVPAAAQAAAAAPPGATIVRQLPVRGQTPPTSSPGIPATPADKSREKLATLLEVSKGLGRAVDTDAMLDQVEKIIMALPDVTSYSRRTGTQLGFFITEPNTGDYVINLKPRSERRPKDEVIGELRDRIARVEPAIHTDFGQLIEDNIGDLTGGAPQPIDIKIFGSDPSLLEAKARQIAKILAGVRGVADAFDGIVVAGPALDIRVRPEAAARYGLLG
ncbi:MAG: hypothetical protein B7Z72_10790, partial [Gemmatimonadetes bacterium 21-71-4]